MLYRAVVPHILRYGLRVLGADRAADGVRADRRGPVQGLSRIWPHHRAHYFFARARWQPDDLGLALARLVVSLLVPAGDPVRVAVDDTLFRRRGKKVWAASWFHDGYAAGKDKTGYGNNWVIAGIVVMLPMVSRPVCLPVLARVVIKALTPGRGCGWPAA